MNTLDLLCKRKHVVRYNDKQIPNRFGLRHKAAVGITEKTDALAIVVSEETGHISYIKNGEFISYDNQKTLSDLIKEDLN